MYLYFFIRIFIRAYYYIHCVFLFHLFIHTVDSGVFIYAVIFHLQCGARAEWALKEAHSYHFNTTLPTTPRPR